MIQKQICLISVSGEDKRYIGKWKVLQYIFLFTKAHLQAAKQLNDKQNKLKTAFKKQFSRMKILCIILSLVFPFCVNAGILKGKITDEKGIALPFASVFVSGTTIGSSTNESGEYILHLPPGNHRITAQYIGFQKKSFELDIKADEVINHDFRLEEQELQMNEFVLKASEDPAYYIMRKVISKRKFHLNQIKAFQTDMYLKAVVKTREMPGKIMGEKLDTQELGLDSNGKGILYLLEEFATYYSRNGKEKTKIQSVKVSGNPGGLGISRFPEVIGFYENNIRISSGINSSGFISPLSDAAFNHYKFRLLGDFKEENHTIYKIQVSPKRSFAPLFSGTVYIVDEHWALHSLDLLLTKQSALEMMDTLSIRQLYLPLEKGLWVIKQQVIYPTLKILGIDLTGNFLTVYDKQRANEPVPDSLFEGKVISEYDKTANKKDDGFWAQQRPVPLLPEEKKDYLLKDSLRIIRENPVYKDSVRRRENKPRPTDFIINGYHFNGKENAWYLQTNALLTGLANYNTIEGANIAPKVSAAWNLDSSQALKGKLALRYGFANTHFNAISGIEYLRNDKEWLGKHWSAGIEAGKYVFQFNPNNPLEGLYNTISTLFYRQNYLKLYERWNGSVYFSKNYGNGFNWKATASYQERIPLENATDFSFAKAHTGGFTENMPAEFKGLTWEQHAAVLLRLSLSYQPGFTYTRYPDFIYPHRSRWPVFSLSYEKGIPEILNSKTDFDKWRFSVKGKNSLNSLGNFRWNVATGGFFNKHYVSIPDLNHINGNQVILAAPYLESFQLAPYYTFSNDASNYGEAHAAWHTKDFLTNKIPLFKKLRWHLVMGGSAYYVNPDLNYTEAFIGLDNIGFDKLRIFRVDFVQSWSLFTPSISGIRIGIATNSLIKINLSDPREEW